VSWTQAVPQTSLDFIRSFHIDKSAAIIDIGGGESKLVDFLLQEGYSNITVLDISAQALEKTRLRLGEKAKMVKWIVADITSFVPTETYELWHDRATFHFLTTPAEINQYLQTAMSCINENGGMTIGTFSDCGPEKCSGLQIKQYTEETLSKALNRGFEKIKCVTEDHITPFNTVQNFLFCSFKRKSSAYKMAA
jgi:hypothetical protein